MANLTTIATLEAAIAARIEALSATAFAQGTLSSPTWKESPQALAPESAPNSAAHLCFAVWADSVPTEESPGCVRAEPVVVVRFLYRLRSGQQPTDLRASSDAAQQIVDSVRAGFDGVPMDVTESGDRTILSGGWAVIDVRFTGYITLLVAA